MITMGELVHSQLELIPFSPTPQYTLAISTLSWDLLAWISEKEDRILCSFTNFITSPELSGSLYVVPDIYHTQVTEYSLETNFVHNYSQ